MWNYRIHPKSWLSSSPSLLLGENIKSFSFWNWSANLKTKASVHIYDRKYSPCEDTWKKSTLPCSGGTVDEGSKVQEHKLPLKQPCRRATEESVIRPTLLPRVENVTLTVADIHTASLSLEPDPAHITANRGAGHSSIIHTDFVLPAHKLEIWAGFTDENDKWGITLLCNETHFNLAAEICQHKSSHGMKPDFL